MRRDAITPHEKGTILGVPRVDHSRESSPGPPRCRLRADALLGSGTRVPWSSPNDDLEQQRPEDEGHRNAIRDRESLRHQLLNAEERGVPVHTRQEKD